MYKAKKSATAGELAYQAAIGAALGGILGGGSNALDYRSTKKAQQRAEEEAKNAADIDPYSENEIKNMQSNKIVLASDKNSLAGFAENSLSEEKGSAKVKFFLGKISDNLGRKIKFKTGIDLTGYNISISNHEIRKIILNSHGDETKENLRGQRAVTKEDIAKIYDIVKSPDNIYNSGETKQGKPVITFEKQIGDLYFYVQYVSDKHKTLDGQTMYIRKQKSPYTGEDNLKDSLVNTSETTSDKAFFTSTIPQQESTVNAYAKAYEQMVSKDSSAESRERALSEDEKRVKRFIQTAAIKARLDVKYKDMPLNQKAYYKDGTIYINQNRPLNEGMKSTVAHELFHSLEGSKEHDRIVELALQSMGEGAIQRKIDSYGKYGIALDEAGAKAEIGAEYIEKALTDEATINQILLENKSLAGRILERIKDLVAFYKAKKSMTVEEAREYKALLKAKYLYEDGLAKLNSGEYEPHSGERNAAARYELVGRDSDGIEIYETSEEIKKLPFIERKKEFLRLMCEEYVGRTARFVVNGKKYYARFDENDLQKNIYGDMRSSKKGYSAKINAGASGDIFNLVENAKYSGNESEKGKKTAAHRNVTGWDYFVKQVWIDGELYDLIANVRKKNDGEYVYSIQLNENENKKTGASPYVATQKHGSVKIEGQHAPDIDNNIPNSTQKSNTQNAKIDKNNLSNDENARFSIDEQTESPQFKAWFGDSKVVDSEGKPKVVYSGHGNTNLFGSKFDVKKATSGGFYFTENPDIASSYAKDKLGVMERYKDGEEYRFKNAKGEYKDTIDKVRLSEEQVEVFDEWFDEDMGYTFEDYVRENAPYDESVRGLNYNGGKYNLQNIYKLMESLGYVDNGWDYRTQQKKNSTFEDLLDDMGIVWDSYTKPSAGVFPVYLSIKNPIDTSKEFPQDLMNELEYAASKERKSEGAHWTKDYPLKKWVEDIKNDDGLSGWATQVPTKARKIMLEMGYDGIKDTGGKQGGAEHVVWVALEPTQVKSAIGNRGTFDAKKADIRYSIDEDASASQGSGSSDKKVGYRFFDNTFQNTPIFDDAVKEIERSYEHERSRVSEKENIAEARQRLRDNGWYKEINTVLKKNSVDGADTDVAMAIIAQLNNYEPDSAEFGRIMKFAEDYADKTVESGQFIQSLAKYTRTPVGKTEKAMRDIKREERKVQKSNPKKWNDAEKKAAGAKRAYNEAQEEAANEAVEKAATEIADSVDMGSAEKILNEASKKNRKAKRKKNRDVAQEIGKSAKGAQAEAGGEVLKESRGAIKEAVQKQVKKKEVSDAELLSRKVDRHTEVSEAEKESMRDAIIKEMYQLAKESGLPELRKREKQDSIDVLREMLLNKDIHTDTWEKAQEILKEKYKDDKEKSALLQEFFANHKKPPYSDKTINKVTNELIEEFGIDINECLSKGIVPDFAEIIEKRLIKKLGIDTGENVELKEDVAKLGAEVQAKYNAKVRAKLDKKLESFLEVRDDVPKEKALSAKEQMYKLIESGAYNAEEAEKILQKVRADEDKALRSALAAKIESHITPKSDTVDNARLQRDIINELYTLAKESPLPDKAINVQKKDYVKILREILHNQEKYEDVWQDAREALAKKYKNDPEKMKVLDGYFNNYIVPVYSESSMRVALRGVMEEIGLDTKGFSASDKKSSGAEDKKAVRDILLESKGDKAKAREEIRQILSDRLGLGELDKQTVDVVTNNILDTYDKMLKAKAEKKLSKFLDDEVKDQTKHDSLKKQMLRMVRNGTFSDDEATRVMRKAYDVPTLTTEEVRTILNYYEKADEFAEGSYDRRKWESRAQKIIEDKIPKTLSEKNQTLRRIAMLTNPATWQRNIFGNIIFGAAEAVKNVPAGLIDKKIAQYTGKRTTSANVIADLEAYGKGLARGYNEWKADIEYGVDTSHGAVREEYQGSGNTFSNAHRLGKMANKAELVMSKALQLGDRPFYEAAYDQRISELKRLGYDTSQENIQAEAKIYALERVYQNDSKLSKALTKVRNELGIFGHFLIPFTQTPGNLLDKCIDYSGAGGIVRAIYQIGVAKKTGNFDQKLFVDRLGRALTGLGVMVLGAFLESIGCLVGTDEDDYELMGAKRLAGEKEYSLRLGDTYITIDWAQPVSAILIAGAEAHKAGMEQDDWMQIGIATGEGVINTLFAMSCLEGLESMMASYGNAEPADKIADVMISGVSQYFPTALRRLNNVIDPIQRQTYSANPIVKQAKYMASGIPGVSYLLDPKYTLEGDVQYKSQGRGIVSRTAENVLSPANIGRRYHSKVNDELLRIYEETGKTNQFLHYAKKNLDYGKGGKYVLSPEDYNRMQKEIGTNTTKAMSALMNSSVYKSMSDTEKAEALSDVAKFYDDKFKDEYAKANRIVYDDKSYQSLKAKIDKYGWAGYFEIKRDFKKEDGSSMNFEVAEKRKEFCDKYGIKYEAYNGAAIKIDDVKENNRSRYTKSSDKAEANKRDIARYLSTLDLTDPQRQVLWKEIGGYDGKNSETYKSVARRYGF